MWWLASLVACGPADPSAPTWSEDIAPIVAADCASCHQDGEIGPFALTDYAHAAPMAAAIAASTGDRVMPPWLADASGACGAYRDAAWLDDDAIDTIAAWAAAGAPAGDATATADAPPVEGLSGPTTDIDIGADYFPVNSPDDHRCFIVDPQFTTTQFVTAYELVPGDASIVHHAVVYALDDVNAEARVAALDAADEIPGYSCSGNADAWPSHALAAWAPGTPATVYPPGTGIRVGAGRKIVIQLHYHLEPGDGPDRTVLRLRTVDSVPNEAAETVLADLGMTIPAGDPHADVVSEYPLADLGPPNGFYIRGVYPHMHLRGRSERLDIVRDGQARCAADLPRWDFNWQRMYLYSQPVHVDHADTLRMTCTYDTTGDAEAVKWGDGTADEMCLMGLLVTLAP